jgi:3-hydroxybutyryl-CoA dehydrogenase
VEQAFNVAVLGAGQMGHGIAQVFAGFGHSVVVSDPDGDALANVHRRIEANLRNMDRATEPVLANITVAGQVTAAVESADVVIETAPERLELKRKLFLEITAHVPCSAILRSNTSVFPITQIGEGLPPAARARLVGTHWWNPPYLVPLVEVVRTEYTDLDVFEKMFELLRKVGKRPVKVNRDITGFIGNRLQYALWREAFSLVESGVCDAETIDVVVKNGFGMRFPVLGPMENADLIGLELARDIYGIVTPDLSCAKPPSRLLSECINEGRLGMKSGEGLRVWTSEESSEVRRRLSQHLLNMLERVDLPK